MKITICASVDFTPKIKEVKESLEKRGWEVNIPYVSEMIINGELSLEDFLREKGLSGDIAIRRAQKVDMIRRYWEFIKNSDAILIINESKKGIDGYIGGSVLIEMGFAYGHNKKIYLYNDLPVRSEQIHYLDEIIDMKPTVINGDLNKIN